MQGYPNYQFLCFVTKLHMFHLLSGNTIALQLFWLLDMIFCFDSAWNSITSSSSHLVNLFLTYFRPYSWYPVIISAYSASCILPNPYPLLRGTLCCNYYILICTLLVSWTDTLLFTNWSSHAFRRPSHLLWHLLTKN